MKTDNYTKVILTVIAVCLTINVATEISWIPTAHASEMEAHSKISTNYRLVPVSETNTMDVRIVDIATYDELNVNLKSVDTYDEIKVNINSIETQDELDVNIDEVGGRYLSSGGPIKVTLD